MFRFSRLARSMEQIAKDMPTSTQRKPRGLHRGPNKRGISDYEKEKWAFMKKTQLLSTAEWQDPENFRHLPKPKKLFGNEAAEIVWPYAVLLKNRVLVHPFTKSVYCYYFQYSLSEEGAKANALARQFAREMMIPITFHNSQCYVETEMLLEYGDTPYLVINSLDERHEIVPISDGSIELSKLVEQVVARTEALGTTVEDPKSLWQVFNDRPNQNQFIRINYQWMGDTPEERNQHLVNFNWDWDEIEPQTTNRKFKLAEMLNRGDSLPYSPAAQANHRYARGSSTKFDAKVKLMAQHNQRAASNTQRWGTPRPYKN